MNFVYDRTVKYNNKKVNIMKDENEELYFERPYFSENYQVIKSISELSLDSSNLINIESFYNRDDKDYYLIKLQNSKSLNFLVQNEILLSIKEINYILYQLTLALQCLHDNNIIHSNLNLDSISIDSQLNLVISNYDYAFDINEPCSYNLDHNSVYNAPELYSFKDITYSTDIYSIGQILKVLVENMTIEDKSQFNYIIEKCTEFDYTKRFKSMREILDLIENYKTPFFPPQTKQIMAATKLGISEENIKKFALPYYNSKQMGVLKHAFDEEVSQDIIDIMLNPNFSSRQMYQIMRGFKDNLDFIQIKKYAKEYFTPEEMAIYRTSLIFGYTRKYTFERLKLYKFTTETSIYSDEQLKIIRYGFYNDIENEKLKVLFNQDFTEDVMRKLLNAIM